jgi:hypothetical protein
MDIMRIQGMDEYILEFTHILDPLIVLYLNESVFGIIKVINTTIKFKKDQSFIEREVIYPQFMCFPLFIKYSPLMISINNEFEIIGPTTIHEIEDSDIVDIHYYLMSRHKFIFDIVMSYIDQIIINNDPLRARFQNIIDQCASSMCVKK